MNMTQVSRKCFSYLMASTSSSLLSHLVGFLFLPDHDPSNTPTNEPMAMDENTLLYFLFFFFFYSLIIHIAFSSKLRKAEQFSPFDL